MYAAIATPQPPSVSRGGTSGNHQPLRKVRYELVVRAMVATLKAVSHTLLLRQSDCFNVNNGLLR